MLECFQDFKTLGPVFMNPFLCTPSNHADIYADGESEAVFGKALAGRDREKMVIQTKCAIRPGCCYDFSGDHILSSVDASLKRLGTEYIDVLLLHRPDALMEPEEVAEAFRQLKKAAKSEVSV